MSDFCPTCGSQVVVISNREGTNHYEPQSDRRKVVEAVAADLENPVVLALVDEVERLEATLAAVREWAELWPKQQLHPSGTRYPDKEVLAILNRGEPTPPAWWNPQQERHR